MPIERQYVTFDGNSYVLPICHNFCDIYCENMHDLDLGFSKRSKSIVNMPFEIPTSHNCPFNDNSNLYHTCYRLRDNHVYTSGIVQIRIFDLQLKNAMSLGTRSPLNRSIENGMICLFCCCVVNLYIRTFYLLFDVNDSEMLRFLILKSWRRFPSRSQIFNTELTKAHNDRQTEEITESLLSRMSNVSSSTYGNRAKI